MRKPQHLFLIIGLMMSAAASADWSVSEESRVHYVSIKQLNIAENNAFTGVTGQLDKQGAFTIAVDLSSVDTGIGIRNERMQKMFFETVDFPEAQLTGKLSKQQLADLHENGHLLVDLPVSLSLYGTERTLNASLVAVKTGEDIVVTNAKPLLIKASDFGLEKGVDALRKIAGLDSIASAIPVTVNLTLVNQKR